MKLLNIETSQAGAVRILVEALKEILTDVNIKCTKKETIENDEGEEEVIGGIGILAVNDANSLLIHLMLDAENFEEYECSLDSYTIGLNMSNFFKYIRSISNLDTLTLTVEDNDPNRLGIKIVNKEKSLTTNNKLNLMDLENDDYIIPPTTFTSVITMSSSDFHKICRDMNTVADRVEITNVGKKLIFRCKSESGVQEITLGEAKNHLNIERDDENNDDIVQGLYDLKNLILFTKFTNLCNNIEIYMKNDYPLVIKYQVASLGNIHLCITSITDNNQEEEEESDDDSEYSEDGSDYNYEEEYIVGSMKKK